MESIHKSRMTDKAFKELGEGLWGQRRIMINCSQRLGIYRIE